MKQYNESTLENLKKLYEKERIKTQKHVRISWFVITPFIMIIFAVAEKFDWLRN